MSSVPYDPQLETFSRKTNITDDASQSTLADFRVSDPQTEKFPREPLIKILSKCLSLDNSDPLIFHFIEPREI
jgi:hypothetical protein